MKPETILTCVSLLIYIALYWYTLLSKKSLKMLSESINWSRTDNTMTKRTSNDLQHRKLKIEQHEPYLKRGVEIRHSGRESNSCSTSGTHHSLMADCICKSNWEDHSHKISNCFCIGDSVKLRYLHAETDKSFIRLQVVIVWEVTSLHKKLSRKWHYVSRNFLNYIYCFII